MEWLEHSTSRFGVLDKSCTCIESFTFKLLKHKSGPLTNWDTSPYKILDTIKNLKKYLFQLNIFPSIFILIAVSVYFYLFYIIASITNLNPIHNLFSKQKLSS